MTREEKQQRVRGHLSAAEDCRLAGQRARMLQHLQAARALAAGEQRREIQAAVDAELARAGRWH